MEYKLREAGEADKEWLYELQKLSYRELVIRQFGAWREIDQRNRFEKKWKTQRAHIILVDGRPAGAVCLRKEDGRHWIDDIQITPSMTSQGLGARIVRDCLKEARKTGAPLRLQVLRENRRARAFYARLGFKVVGEMENHCLMEIL